MVAHQTSHCPSGLTCGKYSCERRPGRSMNLNLLSMAIPPGTATGLPLSSTVNFRISVLPFPWPSFMRRTALLSGNQVISQPAPVVFHTLVSRLKIPVWRDVPRRVMARNLPLGDISGSCAHVLFLNCFSASNISVSTPDERTLVNTFPARAKTMVAPSGRHAPHTAFSATFFSSEPSGLTVHKSHLSFISASFSATQPDLLRQNRMVAPSGENRGNQSTVFGSFVTGLGSVPSAFMIHISCFEFTRDVDHTILPLIFPLKPSSAFCSSLVGETADPTGASWASRREKEARTHTAMKENFLYMLTPLN